MVPYPYVSRRTILRTAALGIVGVSTSALLSACGNLGTTTESTPNSVGTQTTESSTAGIGPNGMSVQASPSAQTTADTQPPTDSGTFVGLVRNHPQTLDPHIGADNPTGKFLIATYEPLIRVKPGGTELEPFLAERWEVSPDGTAYSFSLRENVKFHDGTTMDASAVKSSIERMKQIGLGNAWVLEPVEQVRTPDASTVTIELAQVHAPFLDSVPLIFIVSEKAVQDHAEGDDLAQGWLKENEAGTGPYVLAEWQQGQILRLTKFADYWRGWGGSHFSEIILQLVPEPSTQRQLMEAGQADWADSIGVDDLVAMENSGEFTVIAEPSLSLFWAMMNTHRPPLDNVTVRRAMRYAFDYESLVNNIMKGMGRVARGYLPPQYAAHDPNIPPEEFDLEKARTLISEAGLSDADKTLEMVYFNGTAWQRPASELFANLLSQLGFTLNLQGVPWATMLTKLTEPDQRPHFALYSATGSTSSPDSVFGQTFYSQSKHWSVFGYGNPEVDQLIREARSTLDDDARTAIYHRIQQVLQEDSPGINLLLGTTNHVFRKEIEGFVMMTFRPDQLNYYDLYRTTT